MKNGVNISKKKLIQIFDKYITVEQYGQFKEIIDEILYRRAITFGFSKKRMEQECKNLNQNLKAICFYKGESDFTFAFYSEKDQNIYINENSFHFLKEKIHRRVEKYHKYNEIENDLLGLSIFSTFSHELYHAISTKQITEERHYQDNIIFNRTAINEIVTEAAAHLTTSLENESDVNGYLQTLGYSDFMFFGALLACALGVSEKELYKNALNNSKEWNDFLKIKIPGGKNNKSYINFEDFLDYMLDTNQRNISVDVAGLIERKC